MRMPVTIGPDGFLCAEDNPSFRFHASLADFLIRQKSGDGAALDAAFKQVRKSFTRPQQVELVTAIYQRIGWIDAHRDELSEPARWQAALARLAKFLYRGKLPFSEPDLRALLQAHRTCHALWFEGPEERVQEYLESGDLTPELCAELRRFQSAFQAELRQTKYTGQAGLQAAQRHLQMLLWHDEWDDLDLAACWSEIIRRDYRAMTGERRARWKALLRHIGGNAPVKPPKNWIKEAETLLAAVGLDDFRGRLGDWFGRFRGPAPQRLSVAGSHVLKGLLWYCALARDAGVTEAALWLLDATWKPKRYVDKSAVALLPLLETMPASEAWAPLLRLQRDWPTPGGQIEQRLKAVADELGIGEQELKDRGLVPPAPQAPSVADQMEGLRAAFERLKNGTTAPEPS
jgi:hypothetical protein